MLTISTFGALLNLAAMLAIFIQYLIWNHYWSILSAPSDLDFPKVFFSSDAVTYYK